MSERGLPIVDGAPACPFVAFEDDRDERSTSPDHRHRCYAEVRPAPRAIAHQEAYCLASAFPVCPTFQDWAKREAARVQPPPEPVHAGTREPERNPKRSWLAPPPWASEAGEATTTEDAAEAPGFLAGRAAGTAPPAAEPGPTGTARTFGTASSRAEPPPAPVLPEPNGDERDRRAESVPARDRDRFVPSPSRGRRDEDRDAAREVRRDRDDRDEDRHAASDAHRRRDDRDEDRHAASDAHRDRDERDDDGPPLDPFARRYSDRSAATSGLALADRRPKVSETRPRRPEPQLRGPSWEEPRRREAYPVIRSPLGLPSLPRLGIFAAALVIAAVTLFFLPALLPLGGSDDDTGALPTASPTPVETATPAPTERPDPTPQLYVVQAGDTMSRIATRFNVPLDALIEANRETIPNPDRLAIGDEVIIPVRGGTVRTPPPAESPAP